MSARIVIDLDFSDDGGDEPQVATHGVRIPAASVSRGTHCRRITSRCSSRESNCEIIDLSSDEILEKTPSLRASTYPMLVERPKSRSVCSPAQLLSPDITAPSLECIQQQASSVVGAAVVLARTELEVSRVPVTAVEPASRSGTHPSAPPPSNGVSIDAPVSAYLPISGPITAEGPSNAEKAGPSLGSVVGGGPTTEANIPDERPTNYSVTSAPTYLADPTNYQTPGSTESGQTSTEQAVSQLTTQKYPSAVTEFPAKVYPHDVESHPTSSPAAPVPPSPSAPSSAPLAEPTDATSQHAVETVQSVPDILPVSQPNVTHLAADVDCITYVDETKLAKLRGASMHERTEFLEKYVKERLSQVGETLAQIASEAELPLVGRDLRIPDPPACPYPDVPLVPVLAPHNATSAKSNTLPSISSILQPLSGVASRPTGTVPTRMRHHPQAQLAHDQVLKTPLDNLVLTGANSDLAQGGCATSNFPSGTTPALQTMPLQHISSLKYLKTRTSPIVPLGSAKPSPKLWYVRNGKNLDIYRGPYY